MIDLRGDKDTIKEGNYILLYTTYIHYILLHTTGILLIVKYMRLLIWKNEMNFKTFKIELYCFAIHYGVIRVFPPQYYSSYADLLVSNVILLICRIEVN